MKPGVWKTLLSVLSGPLLLALSPSAVLQAQAPTVNELKAKIFDATMLKQTFVNGLRFCNELNGSNFYFEPRNRVINLEEFHRSLDNLAREGVFNPDKRRPWNTQDAAERWQQVQREAVKDKSNCELVASLPALQKQLEELQKTDSSEKKEAAEKTPEAPESKAGAADKKN